MLVLAYLFVQYQINVWNRTFFDALEQKNAAAALYQALFYIPLVCASVFVSVSATYCRMTTQRLWREWLTNHALDRWMQNGHYYHLNLLEGEHQNPEYRIGEDIRVATEAPVDFLYGILSAVLSAVTFIVVLWSVGGALDITLGGTALHIPGFLVIAALIYSLLGTGSMIIIGSQFVRVAETSQQREAEFRYALTRLRENGESIALLDGEKEERAGLSRGLGNLLEAWRLAVWQNVRTAFVSHTSGLIAQVVPVLLCAPKYLAGDMTLGQVMQAASAFVIVQTAFSWLVDNYPRFAIWHASARRITSLFASIDALERAEKAGGITVLSRSEYEGKALQLRGVSVTLDDGTGVVQEAEVDVAPGERVLIVGESGTGKSTLVRAIAGLWPWGEGRIVMQRGTKLLMLPQRAYVPLGSLRRAATYPMAAEDVKEEDVREALEAVGLGHLTDRIEEEGPWEQTLSGGEKQRLAFARLLLHRPDLIVLDEATSALDPDSQAYLMELVNEKLPDATVISVAHRPELEAYHGRKLVLEHRRGGARLIRDEYLTFAPGPRVKLLRRLFRKRRRAGETEAEAKEGGVPADKAASASRKNGGGADGTATKSERKAGAEKKPAEKKPPKKKTELVES